MGRTDYLVVDLDGTLMDTTELNNEAYARALRECLGIDLSFLLCPKGLRFDAQMLDRLLISSYCDCCSIDNLKARVVTKKKELLFALDPQLAKVHPIALSYLERYAHLPCFLLTNAQRDRAYCLLDRLGLCSYFIEVYCNPDPKSNKYSYLREQLPSLDPKRGLILENEPEQMLLAIEAGFSSDVVKLIV